MLTLALGLGFILCTWLLTALLVQQMSRWVKAEKPTILRALGLLLASRSYSQVSLNVTLPDVVPVDPIVEWIGEVAASHGARIAGTELIGVIRERDLATAGRLPVRPDQIV